MGMILVWEIILITCCFGSAVLQALSFANLQGSLSTRRIAVKSIRSTGGSVQLNIKNPNVIIAGEGLLSYRTEFHVEKFYMEDETDSSVVIARVGEGDGFCQGALTKDDNTQIYQARISELRGDFSVDLVAAVFHELILRYLEAEEQMERNDSSIIPSTFRTIEFIDLSSSEQKAEDGSKELLAFFKKTGLIPERSMNEDFVPTNDSLARVDLHKFVPSLHEYAFQHRGTRQSRTALKLLSRLSTRRVPFVFEADLKSDGIGSETTARRSVISHEKKLFSSSTVEEVMGMMKMIKERKWLSTNPDSVDGLPSLHLNLISGGSPMFDETQGNGEETDEVQFQTCIAKMTAKVQPELYEKLLPRVRELTKSQTVEISDVFIRSYGQLQLGKIDDEVTTRYSLSSHYDVTSFATCVIALDESAVSGRSGLYTIPLSNDGKVSNHSALKNFFPLEMGDGVMHTYDILHGVDVDPALNSPRTSLIVWFVDQGSQEEQNIKEGQMNTPVDQPWLLHPKIDDDVGQFILALASDCGFEPDGSEMKIKRLCNQFDLYLSSASCGNAFALTSLGELCDNDLLPHDYYSRIDTMLRNTTPSNPFLPEPTLTNCSYDDMNVFDTQNQDVFIADHDSTQYRCKALAKALWYKASISGNRIAQVSLADELMLEYMASKQNGDTDTLKFQQSQEDTLLMASTLFTMALNQGFESALDSLKRLMDIECKRLTQAGFEIPSEDFFMQPVVKNILLSS